jgi:signal transduction histidine kinase
MVAGIASQEAQRQAPPPAEAPALPGDPATAGASDAHSISFLQRMRALREAAMDTFVPSELQQDTEAFRRARLITTFGLLGAAAGGLYAVFYLLIGHLSGAIILSVGSTGVLLCLVVLRLTRSICAAGNLIVFILLTGFFALCCVEGGIEGLAIAWLAAVPLCALLLVEGPEVMVWCTLGISAVGVFIALDLAGIRVPLSYPPAWHQYVGAAGYLGFTIFLSILGISFEYSRRSAFNRMRKAMADVSQVNERLKKVDVEKDKFLGIAAHDLRNPLNIVLGFAESIVTSKDTSHERDKQDAGYILQAAERMMTIITQMLDIHAIEEGRFAIEITRCDLVAISRQATASFSTAAQKKGLHLHVTEAAPALPILADPRATYRILENLVSNAIKYSPPGREIYIRLRANPDFVTWEIEDQGAGLTEADHARLFQKFAKLSARPTAGEASTGLGLSIVKMLAEAMNGRVGCRSVPGHGATFHLTLPPSVSD